MFTLKDQKVIANNEVIINGFKVGALTDEDAYKLADIVSGFMAKYSGTVAEKPVTKPSKTVKQSKSTKTTDSLSTPDEKPYAANEVGELLYQTDFISVRKYKGVDRLYIHVPYTLGNKADGVRYAIKQTAKKYGAKWAGNRNFGIYFWTLEDAQGFIAEQKKMDEERKKAQK